MAAMESSSSCGPHANAQPAPPMAHAPTPMGVMFKSLLPSCLVCISRITQYIETSRNLGPPQEGDDRILHVMKIDPLETRIVEIHLIERGTGTIQAIQLARQVLQLAMEIEGQQIPSHGGIVIPLLILSDLRSHEEQLF